MDNGIDPKKIFVGNLSWDVTGEKLQETFEQIGEVESAVIINGPDGRSKGFGFVVFVNEEDTAKAISELNGKELLDRPMNVDRPKPRTERPDRGGYGGGGRDRGGRRW